VDRFLIKKENWRKVNFDGKNTARVKCPKCGIEGLLNHEVDKEGNVNPSVVCGMKCGFHSMVKLEGWEDK